ncbi:uncharacterized protein LOC144142404 isoform X1 [Haemaphysalis longicornis]
MGRPRVVRTPEEQLAYEARRRELRKEYKRRHRAANTHERARHAERMRRARRDEAYRKLENAAKRRKYHASKIEKIKAKMSGRRNMAARAGVISSRNVARRVTKAAVTTANKGEQCWLSRPRATQTPRTSLRSAACQTEIITYPGSASRPTRGATAKGMPTCANSFHQNIINPATSQVNAKPAEPFGWRGGVPERTRALTPATSAKESLRSDKTLLSTKHCVQGSGRLCVMCVRSASTGKTL